MRLLEYESKDIFEKYKVSLNKRLVINNKNEIDEKVKQFMFPAIIKSQIPIGSRKKAGLIRIANSKEEAVSMCKEFFDKKINKYSVEAILIEELADIQHEYYCSITLNESARKFVLIASAEGGIEIEDVAKSNPDAIIKQEISLSAGLDRNTAEDVAKRIGLKDELVEKAADIFLKLWEITIGVEGLLVEINPLVLTPKGFIAVDGKMILDDNAVFRQEIIEKLDKKKLSPLEKRAHEQGFSFVQLDGDIGILANGAGLTMALLDILSLYDLKPANFLDVGGGASKERVHQALSLIFELKPKAIIINIFGGITRCDIVAAAIVQTLKEIKGGPPVVIRLTGTNDKEGLEILQREKIHAYTEVMDAIKKLKEVIG